MPIARDSGDFVEDLGNKASRSVVLLSVLQVLSLFAECFNNPKIADMNIIVGGINVPAHRLILCLQSEYFSNALDGAFAEGSTNTLTCLPGKEHAYLRVIRYLYTGDYEDEPSCLITNEG
jgi:hypothetical protein